MKTRRIRNFLLIAIVLCMAGVVDFASARQVVVKRKDGRAVRGELVSQTDEQVTLDVDGIPTSIKRADIESVEDVQTIEDLYRERRSRIRDDDVDGRWDLARWLYEQKAYRLALDELTQLHEQFPEDRRVKTLLGIVSNRVKQIEGDSGPASPASPAPGNRPSQPSPPQDAATPQTAATKVYQDIPTDLLNEDQMNLIKLYEVDLTERPPVRIPREVIESLFTDYAGSELIPKNRNEQLQFRRLAGWQQLEIIFRLQARELYPRIEVRALPPALRNFKSTIQRRYVVSYCATAGCHGGKQAGEFFLFSKRANDDPTVFTNFYILSEYRNQDGDMIDRGNPERSLLLQYGLPREAASTPHPEVEGWRPEFRTERDRQYQLILEWLGSGLYSPKPDYGIDYPLPQIAPPAEAPQPQGEDAGGAAEAPAGSPQG